MGRVVLPEGRSKFGSIRQETAHGVIDLTEIDGSIESGGGN
jgi:hypothetical protein